MKGFALVTLIACATPRPPTVVTLEPMVEVSEPCLLPPIPEFRPMVGYPDAKTIYVTLDDLKETLASLDRVAAWLRAAQHCLAKPPRYVPAPNR